MEDAAASLKIPPECLFSERILEGIENRRATLELDAAKVFALSRELPALPSAEFDAAEMAQAVAAKLKTLTPREELVIRRRFGIGEDEQTLEEAARAFNVTRERIRQIERKALRKLQHPTRAADLEPFYRENQP